ncbi:MAG: YkgJ family cysteine cluster protein [Phycisphaerales bacterium]|nr:MAG: YkgJ family cysteine cluster protein [Phycisphaerales bacterium]
MKTSRSLPVIMPNVANQRWSCHSCGNCCRTLVIHLSDEECKRIDRQGWEEKLGAAPYVYVGRGRVLNKRSDGDCVFLDENTRCRIHNEYGEQSKPLACRVFPFSVRARRGGWQASIRFDCPSVVSSKGTPIGQHRPWLMELVKVLDHGPPEDDDEALLQRGVRAAADEIDMVINRFARWLQSSDLTLADRLIGAARITTTLADTTLKKVRGPRFATLLDLLFNALPGECGGAPAAPTERQRGMLRQLAFAHAEHVTPAEMQAGLLRQLGKRWRQLRDARCFLKGQGRVPQLPGLPGEATFETVESVGPAIDHRRDIEDSNLRYLTARLEGSSVFGDGYYGWPVFDGLAALWLSLAAASWLARCGAASEGKSSVSVEDIGKALGMVDRAATRLPALGTMTERARVSYLLKDDGMARLIHAYSLSGGSP